MHWINYLVVAVIVVVFLMLKRSGQIPAGNALAYLKNGAMVIDVRTASEFGSGHLPNAINVPLDQIETALPRQVTDKNKFLLLHCQSGIRSGMAKTKLKHLGYTNSFNLGSYARAAKIVSRSQAN